MAEFVSGQNVPSNNVNGAADDVDGWRLHWSGSGEPLPCRFGGAYQRAAKDELIVVGIHSLGFYGTELLTLLTLSFRIGSSKDGIQRGNPNKVSLVGLVFPSFL